MSLGPVSYLALFLQSNALEWPVSLWGYRKHQTVPTTLALVTLSNLVTHPIVFFWFLSIGWPQLQAVLAAEVFAIVGEALLHWKFGVGLRLPSTFLWSTAANLVSWQVAPLLTWLWTMP